MPVSEPTAKAVEDEFERSVVPTLFEYICIPNQSPAFDRDWRTAGRKPVKNVDLWLALEHEIARHEIEWHWVRGHSGHEGNETADRLANRGIDELLAGQTG